jgi:hypothetical protein
MTKKTKKNSAMKKLIPAIGMLAVSGMMLASSTYAWFTMNKTVEVTGIKMTATSPASIQLSLGLNQNAASTSDSAQLTATSESAKGVKLVAAPKNDDASLDWTNSVAFSSFYAVPKLTPASSINGTNIWTTDNANGVGKTVDATGTSVAGTEGTLTLITSAAGTSTYTGRADFVDFPVWLRAAGTDNVQLKVSAKTSVGATTAASSATNKTLYKAARVAVLTGETPTAGKVIIPSDGDTAQTVAKYYSDGKALSAAATLGEQGAGTAYGTVVPYDNAAVVTVPGKGQTVSGNYAGNCTATDNNANTLYGDATCVIVRVWLEGEDEDCWNATEGQDFVIDLKFEEYSAT